MLLITNPQQPAVCARCGREIAVLITAATPRNRRPHIVQVATAYVRTRQGEAICADCWPEHVAEEQLILAVAGLAFRMPKQRELDADVDDEVLERAPLRAVRGGVLRCAGGSAKRRLPERERRR